MKGRDRIQQTGFRFVWISLEAGDSIEQFLEGFPSVKREQGIALLEESRAHVLAARRGAARTQRGDAVAL